MATTPPLRTITHTPPTPLHGGRYDPYYLNSTRKSTRNPLSRSQRAIETPPPHQDEPLPKFEALNSRRTNTLRSAAHTYSPPSPSSSAKNSPRKKSTRSMDLGQAGDRSAMNGTGPASKIASDNVPRDGVNDPAMQQSSLNLATGMLPTPAKTPRKKPVQTAAINAAARVLFPSRPNTAEDAMPTPRKKKSKRHVGFSLYSESDEDANASLEGNIQIFTDSKDKIPEFDPSEDNPFNVHPSQDAPPLQEASKKKKSKKRKIGQHVEDSKEIEEAFNREEGMVYVFRGKKIYRKFPNNASEPSEADDADRLEAGALRNRPLIHASIKPRLLFPPAQHTQSSIEDEEAPTDIEEAQDHAMSNAEKAQEVTTPIKQSVFSPATPPTTIHATRAATKKAALDGSSPLSPAEPVEAILYEPRGKKVSPFDGWARTKAGIGGAGRGKKREGDVMEKNEGAGGASKKIRSNAVV